MLDLTPDYIQVYIAYNRSDASPGANGLGAGLYNDLQTGLSIGMGTGHGSDPIYNYDEIYSRLPAFRREHVDKISNPAVKSQSVMAFGLLILGLEDIGFDTSDPGIWDELKYSFTEHGKPYFAGRSDIHFSLSHTQGAVMCSVSGAETGCDIDSTRSRSSLYSVAKKAFTPRELSFCMRTPTVGEDLEFYDGICIDPEAFCHIWTRKEAYSKYTGEGLGGIMAGFDIDGIDAYVHSEGLGRYVWAVCTPGRVTVNPVVISQT